MAHDAISRSVYLILTALAVQSASARLLPPPSLPGVGEQSNRFTRSAQYEPLPVPLDTIEDDPDPFLGREISVDAEVEEILGEGIFTIDEPGWLDFDREVLVVAPLQSLTVVREGDRVTVTGRLLSSVEAALGEESAQIERDRRDELTDRSIIIAIRIEVRQRETGGRPADRDGLEVCADTCKSDIARGQGGVLDRTRCPVVLNVMGGKQKRSTLHTSECTQRVSPALSGADGISSTGGT
jgi:hypothetical protein